MPMFIVKVREIHISSRLIEAKDEEEAINKIENGEGKELYCRLEHSMDPENWEVEPDPPLAGAQ